MLNAFPYIIMTSKHDSWMCAAYLINEIHKAVNSNEIRVNKNIAGFLCLRHYCGIKRAAHFLCNLPV